MLRSRLAKGALAACAALTALTGAVSVPVAAQAQPYGGGSYYDPCRRDSTNRSTAGALIGGALGAVIGSNAAARNARTEGALLGGALGATAGAVVGNRSAACQEGYVRPPRTSYYEPSRPYNDGRYYDGRYYDRSSAYDGDRYHGGAGAYTITERPGADGCTLAESPIYLPDGRVQKRFVRVCQDASGRYQVVD